MRTRILNLMKVKLSKIVKENFDILKKNTQFSSSVKERKLRKMAKRTIFSRPVFSFRRTLRPLISLAATLCLASGTLVCTFPAFAASQLTVVINGLGNAKSANALFHGQPLDGQCATKGGSRIAGNIGGAGQFSVNFYSTDNCTGKRSKPSQFTLKQGSPGGLVVCNSDTNCFFNELTSKPNNKNSAISTVLFKGLGNAQGVNIAFGGVQQGSCITADEIKSGNNMVSVPLTGNGMFSVNFFPNTSCTGKRGNFSRFNAPQGSNGIFVTCNSDTDCKQA